MEAPKVLGKGVSFADLKNATPEERPAIEAQLLEATRVWLSKTTPEALARMAQDVANYYAFAAFARIEPQLTELLRQLKYVDHMTLVFNMLDTCIEEARARVLAETGYAVPEFGLALPADYVDELSGKRIRQKPGPKPQERAELLERWAHFLKSGLSKNKYCELEHISKHTLKLAEQEAKRVSTGA